MRLTTRKPRPQPQPWKLRHFDLELEVLQAVTAGTGHRWMQKDIADICGVSKQAIQYIERRGLTRLRRLLLRDDEISDALAHR